MKLLISSIVLVLLTTTGIAQTTVYVTNTGSKYHEGDCRYLSKSKHSMTLAEAVQGGYTACSVCKPLNLNNEGTVEPTKATQTAPKPNTNISVSVQCHGTTQKGARCKRMTKEPSGYCYQHK